MARPALSSAVGSYDKMPPNPMITAYIPSESARRAFVDGMAEVQVKRGEIIMRQGDKGNNFYLIKEGQCEVVVEARDGKATCVRRLSAGAGCGELAILDDRPRSATITATSSTLTLLIVNKRTFMEMIGNACRAKRSKYEPFLGEISVLAGCSGYDRNLIADVLEARTYKNGDILLSEDAHNDKFWMVVEGEVEDAADAKQVLRRGDHFGEMELFKNQRTSRTLVAKGTVIVATLMREQFLALVPLTGFVSDGQTQAQAIAINDGAAKGAGIKDRSRRVAQSAEPTTAASRVTEDEPMVAKTRKSSATRSRIRKAVQSHLLFARLEPEQFDSLIDHMAEHKVSAGTVIIREGEKGNHFYIVDAGECDAFTSSVTANGGLVKTFNAGDSFGELALMYNCPRTATVSARTDSILWSIDRASFRRVLLEENARKASLYEEFLEAVPLLRPLSKAQRNRMVDALEPVSYKAGESIITEGKEGTHFYVIESGEVNVSNKANGHLAKRSRGDYFGEVSLRTGDPCMATVTAHSATVKLVRMERGAFQRLLGALDSLIKLRQYSRSGREIEEAAEEARRRKEGGAAKDKEAPKPIRTKVKMSLADFKVSKKILGEGAFGRVRRAHHLPSGKLYALKEMSKDDIVTSGQVEHILQESEVLDFVSHPAIANKIAAFQTDSHLYMIMEFAPGGDLYDKLQHARQFPFDDARVYISQVLLALEHLHAQSIVHRDLKLENLLVSQDGAIKLTDFGFAKKVLYRTWTLCGTPEYLAPEIVLEKGHNKAADYWALGVLLFEFLTGHSPFEAEDHMSTYKKILAGKVHYPKRMDTHAVSLCSNLLQRDISRRYGNLKDGVADIKRHAFFHGFDWDKALDMRGTLKPAQVSIDSFTDWVRAKDVCVPGKKLSPKDDKLFASFSD